MNFKRVERILIVAFILLNMYLVSVAVSYFNVSSSPSGQATLSIEEELINSNILFPELSEENQSLPYIQINNDGELMEILEAENISVNGITSSSYYFDRFIFEETIQLSEGTNLSEEDRVTIQSFLKSGRVPFGDMYVYFDYRPQLQQLIFTQAVDGIPIADGSSSISLNLDDDWNLTSYDQSITGKPQQQGGDVSLISEKNAVEILFQNNHIRSNATVHAPRLVYQRILDNSQMDLYVPAWYVKIINENNSVSDFRVDATNGNIITNLPNPRGSINNVNTSPSAAFPETVDSTSVGLED